jgi:hypothetical protein
MMPTPFPQDPELTQAAAEADARDDFEATRYRGEPKPEPIRQTKLFERLHWIRDEQSLFSILGE